MNHPQATIGGNFQMCHNGTMDCEGTRSDVKMESTLEILGSHTSCTAAQSNGDMVRCVSGLSADQLRAANRLQARSRY
jgi:hypothetical protein